MTIADLLLNAKGIEEVEVFDMQLRWDIDLSWDDVTPIDKAESLNHLEDVLKTKGLDLKTKVEYFTSTGSAVLNICV